MIIIGEQKNAQRNGLHSTDYDENAAYVDGLHHFYLHIELWSIGI